MVDQWFFAWGNSKFGPFSTTEMRELAAIGRLQPTDTVWKQGVENGVLASRIKNLFPMPLNLQPVSGEPVEARAVPATVVQLTAAQEVEPAAPVDILATDAHEQAPPESSTVTPAESSAEETSTPVTVADAQPEKRVAVLPEKKKAMATGAVGAILLSQDGKYVQYRKKCRKCGFEDAARSSMQIKNGAARQVFFCPKCRKPSEVEIRGKA